MRSLVLSEQLQAARFEFNRQELIQDPWKQLSHVSALRPLRKNPWGGGPRKASQGSLYMSHIMSSHLFSIRILWRPPGHAGEFCPCSFHRLAVWEGTGQHKPTNPGGIRLFSWLPCNPQCKIPCPSCSDMKISIRCYSSSFLVAVETNLNETLVFWKRIWV